MSSSTNPSKSAAVSTYRWPGGHLGRNIIITGIIMALSSRREVLSAGSPIHDYLLAGRPKALKYATYVQAGLFYFLFGAHAIETVVFGYTRLHKHGVPVLSVAWFQWIVACLVGGKFTIEQFDGLVAGKKV